MNEVWKGIDGYPNYEVSNMGRVRSFWVHRQGKKPGHKSSEPQRILDSRTGKNGYPYVSLWRDKRGINAPIHRLVLAAFVSPRPNGMWACHNDGNRQNNRLDNLRWDTVSNNMMDKLAHGTMVHGSSTPSSKLSENQVEEIRRLKNQGEKQVKIAALFNISQSAISNIITRKTWKHI